MLYTFYILMGCAAGIAAVYAMWDQIKKRVSEHTRHTVALDRNTEVTERLNDHMERLNDKLDGHEKRLDRIEYKVFGFHNA
jgi:hypothetical protein